MNFEFQKLVYKHYSSVLSENSEISGEFEKSPEFSVLWSKLYEQDHSKLIKSLREVKKFLGTSNVKDCDRISIIDKRCVGLKCLLNRSFSGANTIDKFLVVSLSLIAPIFFFEILKINHHEGIFINDPKIMDGDFSEDLLTLSEKLKMLGFDRLEKDECQKKIEQITFPNIPKGEFTYFNAYFANTLSDLFY
ncbi:hypothetical protein U3A58_12010 [Algoriphagus sp. C2-6-M1]|uniref:hypothetical protein n=1 Tax=Algoriphagus persicinus TaxID=3108754 RepID=UPI002B3802A0|nr:hypothetical protein [Algoriphagus sp. C2-6-M1]MEB2781118.1 hypothetical protein [Algoriphagus sp. C2-6-M1]